MSWYPNRPLLARLIMVFYNTNNCVFYGSILTLASVVGLIFHGVLTMLCFRAGVAGEVVQGVQGGAAREDG